MSDSNHPSFRFLCNFVPFYNDINSNTILSQHHNFPFMSRVKKSRKMGSYYVAHANSHFFQQTASCMYLRAT